MCCDCDCYGFLVAVMRANLMAPFWNPLNIHRVAKAPLIVVKWQIIRRVNIEG